MKGLKAQMKTAGAQAEMEASLAVNKTTMEATLAVKAAMQEKSAALAALPEEEVNLKKANDALGLAQKALMKAQADKAYMKAWTQNQLATALRAVKRAATAANNVAA